MTLSRSEAVRHGRPDIALRRRVFSLPTLLAFLLASAVLAVTVSRVFDINWTLMWRQILATNLYLYGLGLFFYYLSFVVRGLRWRLIAKTAGLDADPAVKLPGAVTSGALILMGWFANSVAFLRLGDAYRGWAFARESGASFPGSLGTVLAERVQDMAAVLILIVAAAVLLTVTGTIDIPGRVVAAAFVLVLALLLLLAAMRLFGLRLATRLPRRLESAYGRFHGGTLKSFRPSDLPLQMGLGILGWLLEIARLYFVAQGLGIEMGLAAVMFAALASAMLTTIPTPGGFGFVEGGMTGVLILMGLDDTSALALTIVDRSISWVSVVVFGGLLFLVWHVLKVRKPAAATFSGAADSGGEADGP